MQRKVGVNYSMQALPAGPCDQHPRAFEGPISPHMQSMIGHKNCHSRKRYYLTD